MPQRQQCRQLRRAAGGTAAAASLHTAAHISTNSMPGLSLMGSDGADALYVPHAFDEAPRRYKLMPRTGMGIFGIDDVIIGGVASGVIGGLFGGKKKKDDGASNQAQLALQKAQAAAAKQQAAAQAKIDKMTQQLAVAHQQDFQRSQTQSLKNEVTANKSLLYVALAGGAALVLGMLLKK